MMRILSNSFKILILLSLFIPCPGYTQESKDKLVQRFEHALPKFAGEFFGTPVPMGNYYFAKRAVVSFNASWRGTPKNEDELEDLVWQELLFSYEAFKRNIEAASSEVDQEIEKMLKADKVDFNWKEDKEEYRDWLKERLRIAPEAFRNQIEHLVKLEKLRKQVIESIEPEVQEKEAYQKFLDEVNTLSVELLQFVDLKEAKEFYQEITKAFTKGVLGELIWRDLALSYEALKRRIEVEDSEIDKVISNLLRNDKVKFNWKKDKESYQAWVKEKIGASEEIFRKHIAYFVSIDELIRKIAKGQEPAISEEYQKIIEKSKNIPVAYKKFIKTYRVPVDKLLRFNSFKKAEEFYKKIKREPGIWEERKRKDPKSFKRPGFVALDFLVNLWGFKREDAYKMLELNPGDFYPPSPIYRDYAIFKILDIRRAERSKFEQRKDYYFSRVKVIKRYEGYKKWVKELKDKANIKVYDTK